VNPLRSNHELAVRVAARVAQRRRRLRRLLKRLPRRSTAHRTPVLRWFARWVRAYPLLWSFRRPHLTAAIYAGSVIAMAPLLGTHNLVAVPVAWLLRANITVVVAIQFINNFVTAAPLALLSYATGRLILKHVPWHQSLPNVNPWLATVLGVLVLGIAFGLFLDSCLRYSTWRHRCDVRRLAGLVLNVEDLATMGTPIPRSRNVLS
jgi:uncharacterized protein (DUF2062 family)